MPRLRHAIALLLTCFLAVTACGGSSPASAQLHSPSPLAGAFTQGLIAYSNGGGIGVLDPNTGKNVAVAPMPEGGAFRIVGPVWGPAPGVAYPVIYFAIHDDRPPERRSSPGVVPYDWLFRADPFTGSVLPVAASADFESEGPFGLVANDHYLALTVGCCTDYQVDVLDLTQKDAPIRILTRPPDQPALFTEGAAPGVDGLIAVRGAATGAWYFLNPSAGVLNRFPLSAGQDDGPVAFSADGTMAAVALSDHGAVIEPVNLAPMIPSPPAAASGSPAHGSPSATTKPATSPAPTARRVNSRLHHPDGLAWSPDSKELAIAVDGGIQIYAANGKDGDKPVASLLSTGGILQLDWSPVIPGRNLASVKTGVNVEKFVDGLLTATALPAAADTPSNRALTKIYLWQFDSSKASPIAAITAATPAVLAKYQPLAASVNYDHWTPTDTWALTGGCIRYRVVVAGSIQPVASTFGLQANTPCLGATPSP